MNIIVCIKQTFDTEAKIRLNQENLIDESIVRFILNPFDEYALEEAIRLAEAFGGRVTAVSASNKDPSKALRQCLAMGVNNAVWLDCGMIDELDDYVYAEVLGRWISKQKYDLLFCGKEAVDDGASAVPSRLAEILDLPQVNVVSSLTFEGNRAIATRDVEGGYEVIEADLPCLLSAQKGLNEPRYPSMRRILQAKKIMIEKIGIEDLGLEVGILKPLTELEEYIIPEARKPGKVLSGSYEEAVSELLATLKYDKKVI